ncbi:MAG TPA: flagellar assembly protein FliW [Rhodocyclaceae bacterium]
MKIESPRFGTLEVDLDKVIEFPRGLPGFEDCHRFTVLSPSDNDPKYFVLQSLDDPAVAFYVADPARFGFSYEIALSDEETAELQLTDPSQAVVVVLLTKPDENAKLSANLNSPLVLNLATRRGLQHLFARLSYDVGN